MQIRRLGLSEWRQALPDSGIEPFHTPDALRVMRRYSEGELHLLGGFKGEELVGLFPVHELRKLGFRLITSPPVGLGIGRLGPIVMPSSPKQRKQEKTKHRFIREALEELEASDPRTLVRISCSPEYTDPRPFQWEGFDVRPAFTYRLPVAGESEDTLLDSFSRDLRKEIQKQDEVEYTIQTGDIRELKETFDTLSERYREQNRRNPLGWGFVRDLYRALGDSIRVYTARSDDGSFLTGMVILYTNDTAYSWKGGTKTSRSVSPTSLLHWRVLQDLLTDPELETVTEYDMYTANNERLTEYKSTFGGPEQPYYIVESGGATMRAVKGMYRLLALRGNPLVGLFQ